MDVEEVEDLQGDIGRISDIIERMTNRYNETIEFLNEMDDKYPTAVDKGNMTSEDAARYPVVVAEYNVLHEVMDIDDSPRWDV